jgi:hypothetical protein
MTLFLAFLLYILHTAQCLPLNSPLLDSYDYIGEHTLTITLRRNELTQSVVGGGPSGLTVANRLSENPAINVLLLEAGPADNNEPWIQIPFFAGQGSTPDLSGRQASCSTSRQSSRWWYRPQRHAVEQRRHWRLRRLGDSRQS